MIATSLALILFLFPLAYSPGPGNLFFAANGARFGMRATIPLNLGYHVATWIVTLAIGFGFAAAMNEFPQLFHGLKIAGSLYVLWLAWKLYRSGTIEKDARARPANFMDGVFLLLLNPKAYVIVALMFTQFLVPDDPERVNSVLLITTIFTINNLIAFTLWAALGDALAHRFRTPESAKRLNILFSAVLAGVAIWMLLS